MALWKPPELVELVFHNGELWALNITAVLVTDEGYEIQKGRQRIPVAEIPPNAVSTLNGMYAGLADLLNEILVPGP